MGGVMAWHCPDRFWRHRDKQANGWSLAWPAVTMINLSRIAFLDCFLFRGLLLLLLLLLL